MKKLFVVAIIALFGITQAQAQVSFRPGLRGGLNFAHFTEGDSYNSNYYDPIVGSNVYINDNNNYTSKTDFYVGIYGALRLSRFYTLQPEIDYSKQGSVIKFIDFNNFSRSTKVTVSYLSLAVINKFTFKKFNVHLGPALEFVVNEKNIQADSEIDLTFQLGAGYNITKNFGVEARIKKGIVPAYYNNSYNGDGDHTNVVFSVGATYTFDVK
jgi:hypothetical protein